MASRLIVKNLPPDCTEDKLRKFFKSYGKLTDCSLKYTKEGKFRKFAFVGFENDECGDKAIQGCHQTFMGTARVQVEKCLPFGDANKPRPWSQYSVGSSANKRKAGASEAEGPTADSANVPVKKTKSDPQFEAFLQAKGVPVEKEIKISAMTADGRELVKELLDGITGDTKLSLIFSGLPSSIKQNSLKEWLNPIRVKAMKIVRNDSGAAAFVSFNRPPDVRRALQRNNEFLGGYKVAIEKVEMEEEEKEEDEVADDIPDTFDRSKEEARVRDEILDSGRLFVRNLPFATKESDLQALFKKYGEVSEVQVIVDKKTGVCKGFAIVEFVFPESAVAAYAAEDGKVFKGRMLHILPGAEKREKEEKEGKEESKGEEKSSFKKEKAAKLKASAAKSHSWNTLFLGPNAVAETLAEKLGVQKSDLLLGESGESAGVRMALAETRLVREVRDFLVANGVKLDAFSRPASKRSDTVIIVKNLPSGVEEEELRRMFERNGAVDKILMPPEAAVSALIVMGNAVDAKKAFKALAYSRFRTQPLYLEWAPGDVFGEEEVQKKKKEKKETKDVKKEEEAEEEEERPKKSKKEMTYEEKMALKKAKQAKVEEPQSEEEAEENETEETEEAVKEEEPEAEEGEVIEPGSTVFVKNLAFDTTDGNLEKLFGKKHRIKSATVSKKLNPADPSKNLSMGFGFVQFYTQEDAKNAIKTLQGAMLDGHCLELKISSREVVDTDGMKRKTVSGVKQGQSTKLIVRNLPFQAKVQEIESLFETFGEIRSIRIPKKVGSRDQHRGFGFVDFLSVGEAKRAFEALSHSTHLYGRRLVLEWAKEDDTVEELREKTAEKFSSEKKALKKQKQRIQAIEKDLTRIDDD